MLKRILRVYHQVNLPKQRSPLFSIQINSLVYFDLLIEISNLVDFSFMCYLMDSILAFSTALKNMMEVKFCWRWLLPWNFPSWDDTLVYLFCQWRYQREPILVSLSWLSHHSICSSLHNGLPRHDLCLGLQSWSWQSQHTIYTRYLLYQPCLHIRYSQSFRILNHKQSYFLLSNHSLWSFFYLSHWSFKIYSGDVPYVWAFPSFEIT